MRTLDNNLLRTGSVSATNSNPNYAVSNLYDETLLSLFQTETADTTSTITITFTADVSVSCLAIGNHNIDTATLTLLNSASGTVYTKSYTTGTLAGLTRDYFPATYSTVRSITFAVTTLSAPVSIGGLYIGQYSQWPYPNISPTIGHLHTGSYSKTEGGILTGKTGVRLETFDVSFSGVEISDQTIISTFIENVQGNKALYLDRYEDSTSTYPLLFCNVKNSSYTGQKAQDAYYLDGITMQFEECK
jgi:hypothetical protein